MIELSDSEIQQIEREALEKYPDVEDDDTGVNLTNDFRLLKRKAFIAGATLYAKRAKEEIKGIYETIARADHRTDNIFIHNAQEKIVSLEAQLQERDKRIAELEVKVNKWCEVCPNNFI